MSIRDRLASLREQVGPSFHNRAVIAAEMLVFALALLLWPLPPWTRSIIPFFLWGWLSLWLRGLGWRDVGLRRPRNWLLSLVAGIAIGASLALVGNLIIRPLVYHLVGESVVVDPRDFSYLQGNLPLFLVLVPSIWLLAGFAEEMVYRGYVLNRLTDLFGRGWLGWGISIVLSALMFWLGHGVYTVGFFLTSSLIGLLNAGLYLGSRRNLWLPIIVHGVADTIGVTLVFLGVFV